jgi:hypothetical protein
MNDDYNETITRNGKTYHYDPDHDVYYSRSTDESRISQWSWVVVVIVLAAICWWLDPTGL